MQALSAGILGNLGSTGDQEFKQSFKDAGGIEKLQELSKSGSLTPTAVRKAAASALTDITTGQSSRCSSPLIAHGICGCLLNLRGRKHVRSSRRMLYSAVQRKQSHVLPSP